MTENAVTDDFVVRTARNVVADLAPDELALFEPVSRAYLRDPRKVLADRARPGAVLGSGIDTVITVLSPVALAVAASVGQHLVDKAGGAAVSGGGRLLKRLRRKKDQGVRPEITREQLDELRGVAVERAKKLGLTDEEAERIGNAMRAGLEREL
jgi:hypothetical protein